jgi:hypothetical protein
MVGSVWESKAANIMVAGKQKEKTAFTTKSLPSNPSSYD